MSLIAFTPLCVPLPILQEKEFGMNVGSKTQFTTLKTL
jgi:hypothetical protein